MAQFNSTGPTSLRTYNLARRHIVRKVAAGGTAFSIGIAGLSSFHDAEHEATIAREHEHTHQEEQPDMNPVGRASILVMSTTSAQHQSTIVTVADNPVTFLKLP